ncbi:type 1 glutamine amidotransferase domain-containing protein [Nocardia lijiangensis]|uniref:type 1 glutamine amidotransferase domain-containing protein n=1 Tax=Nocardia lijiangensis TaxID=299618 RepID=UPI0008304D37|nr:type 1 glutamine amidotransferase domain-containing protein [Nocardia lijiangensis]
MANILFVMTGVDYWTLADGTKHPTGYWAEEFVVPFEALKAAGHRIVVATPGGVVPAVDKGSLAPEVNGGKETADHRAEVVSTSRELANPIALAGVDLADYDAVFYPGGHGPMEDLAVDATSGALLTAAVHSGKPLAVVCHAPAALLAATGADGTNVFAGYALTGFTNAEETQAGFADKAKWLLQDRLVQIGADFREADPWTPNVVVDRNLITGQNPASSAGVAEELLRRLS